MSDRLLDQFLETGLLDLRGNDEWYEHITATANAVASHLRTNPEQIIQFCYAALLPSVENTNPAIQRTLNLLKNEWRTYASVSMDAPTVMLRAIIIDALLTNAALDKQTRTTVALLLASALPHLSVASETDVWEQALNRLLRDVELDAELEWSVPSVVSVPPFPQIDLPSITVSVRARQVQKGTIEQGILAAAGPHNREGHATQGNRYFPNQGEAWSHEFAPLAAETISKAINNATSTRTATAKTQQLADALASAITTYLGSFLDQVASTVRGIEMRSRLLWWKEALVSPSARIAYREVDPKVAPGLMAFDYHTGLPSIAPVSVSAFLREAIQTLFPDHQPLTALDWMRALAADQHAEELRRSLQSTEFSGGLVPLVSLAVTAEPTAALVEQRTVFSPDLPLSATEFGLLTFLELQSIKAVREVTARSDPDQTSKSDRVTAEDSAA